MVESVARLDSLTPRERQCLRLVYGRKTTKEIAGALELAPGTVYRYLDDARRKLGARDRRQAAEWLYDAENSTPPTPIKFGTQSNGIGSTVAVAPIDWPEQPHAWRALLPIRRQGALHNDLGILTRFAWVVTLTIAFASSFGLLAIAVRTISDVVANFQS